MAFKFSEGKDNDKTFKATAKMPKHIKKGIRMGAYISGKQLVGELQAKITQKGRSGRSYKIYRGIGGKKLLKARTHRASSPSEYPAVITGEYRKSIDFLVRGASRLEFGSGNDGLAKAYARILEVGSKTMKKRQPLGKTVRRLGNQVNKNITRQINKQIKLK